MKYSLVLLTIALSLLVGCSDDDVVSDPGNNGNTNNNGQADMAADEGQIEDMNEVDEGPTGPPEISVDVSTLTFENVRIGETQQLAITIRNLGEGDLVLSPVNVGEINRRGSEEIKKGTRWIDQAIVLEGGTFQMIDVLYAPLDEEIDQGLVTIASNDPEHPVVEVRIETLNPYADVEVEQLLKFGFVAVGTPETRTMYVYNRGKDPLQIDGVVKSGLGPFTLAFLPSQQPFPQILQKDEALQVDVTYAPSKQDVERATITINSDDPDEPALEIAVNGNDPSACISLTPRVADFGDVPAGVQQTRSMTIFNCSNTLPLEISKLEFTDDGGGVFTVANGPTLPLTLSGFGTTTFDILANMEEGERTGELSIESTDPLQSPLLINLHAKVP